MERLYTREGYSPEEVVYIDIFWTTKDGNRKSFRYGNVNHWKISELERIVDFRVVPKVEALRRNKKVTAFTDKKKALTNLLNEMISEWELDENVASNMVDKCHKTVWHQFLSEWWIEFRKHKPDIAAEHGADISKWRVRVHDEDGE